MPLAYKTLNDFRSLITAEFRKQLPQVDPTVFGSWARGFNDGMAVAAVALQAVIQDLEKQLFPQTAEGEFLELWGAYEGLPRNSAVGSAGTISQEGIAGTVIPNGTSYRGSNSKLYTTTSVATVVNNILDVASITRSGNTATITTDDDHSYGNGQTVIIAGADQSDYNGTFEVVVTGFNTFTYEVSGTPVTPATGTITATSSYAIVSVAADDTGAETNLDSGAALTLVTPIAGITDSAIVTFDGLTGGASTETDDAYRQRIILSRSIIEGVFTAEQIELAALGITGNTRAFVIVPTASVCPGGGATPVPGQVSVYILRDNDPSIIPSQGILDDTKQAIIDKGKLPAHMSELDLFVLAPTLVTTDFTFTSITPDTPTMRLAVEATLQAFFEDSVEFGVDVQSDSYRGAIQNTQDLVTGEFLISFELSAPTGDIIVDPDEIAALGDVTFT